MSSSLDRFVRQAPGLVQKAQEWLTARRRPIASLAEVKEMLPRLPLSDRWTANDRRNVADAWNNDPNRQRLLTVGGNKDILMLYKSCLRLIPLSPRRYHRVPLPSRIRYNTRDAGPWDPPTPDSDSFLVRLRDLKHQQPDRTVMELRRELRNPAPERDVFGRPLARHAKLPWNALFKNLERLAKEPESASSRRPSDPFLVRRQHLTLLGSALDSMSSMGFPRCYPIDLLNRRVNGRENPKDYPRDSDLRALRGYAILCERERLSFLKP
ncbi:hypothetical protein MFIFM68171_05526 [Madurella fahalii]|uniref:Uncharacterized protein n=1 Tax=Madurella fahalii TaxID=1157608 RepID=A0ABQ0GC27_9PEZI